MKRQKIDRSQPVAKRQPLLVLGCSLIASIALIENLPSEHFFWSSLRDSGHTFVFFQLNLFALHALHHRTHARALNICAVTLGVFVAGLVAELIQPAWGRQASVLDAWYNLLGCAAAACWFAQGTLLPRITALALALLLCFGSLIQPIIYGLEYRQLSTRLPLLIDFSTLLNRLYWQATPGSHASTVSPPRQWNAAPEKSVRLDFLHGQYPGIRFQDFYSDWEGYERLRVQLWHSHEQPLTLTLRIHDQAHSGHYKDRFNRRFELAPGETWIDIPLADIRRAPAERQLNMHNIAAIGLFTTSPSQPLHIYVGEIRLAETARPAR